MEPIPLQVYNWFEFRYSFSLSDCHTKTKEPNLNYYLSIAGRRVVGFIPFPSVLALSEIQTVSFRICTWLAKFISDHNNHYARSLSIGFHVNTDKKEYMCFNQRGSISTLKDGPLKLVDKFNIKSSISSTKNDINTQLANTWTIINWLLVIWKSDLIDEIKCIFFQAVVMSILLYGCTTWTLTKCMEKKLDGNYKRMLLAV